jgi:hypothetical protein
VLHSLGRQAAPEESPGGTGHHDISVCCWGNIEVQNSGLAMVVSGAYGKICGRLEIVPPVSTAQPVFPYLAHILQADPDRSASFRCNPSFHSLCGVT